MIIVHLLLFPVNVLLIFQARAFLRNSTAKLFRVLSSFVRSGQCSKATSLMRSFDKSVDDTPPFFLPLRNKDASFASSSFFHPIVSECLVDQDADDRATNRSTLCQRVMQTRSFVRNATVNH